MMMMMLTSLLVSSIVELQAIGLSGKLAATRATAKHFVTHKPISECRPPGTRLVRRPHINTFPRDLRTYYVLFAFNYKKDLYIFNSIGLFLLFINLARSSDGSDLKHHK